MTTIDVRTFPIALAIVGGSIICMALYVLAIGQHADSLLIEFVATSFIIGIIVILIGAGLYYWERKQFWEHSLLH